MVDEPLLPARPWRVIAAEVTREQDPQKMALLLVELNRALDEQELGKRHPPQDDSNESGVA